MNSCRGICCQWINYFSSNEHQTLHSYSWEPWIFINLFLFFFFKSAAQGRQHLDIVDHGQRTSHSYSSVIFTPANTVLRCGSHARSVDLNMHIWASVFYNNSTFLPIITTTQVTKLGWVIPLLSQSNSCLNYQFWASCTAHVPVQHTVIETKRQIKTKENHLCLQ